mmetsp:Transcript_99483/g.309957  ORF Transcript_99483/g.309957 Transcript_99483/m.309957 type:complete len:209 (+) Transcript_99483:70-696(+)
MDPAVGSTAASDGQADGSGFGQSDDRADGGRADSSGGGRSAGRAGGGSQSTEEERDEEWCRSWLRCAQEEVSELQDALVEVNFTRKAAQRELCLSTRHRLQFIRCRCLELLHGLAEVPDCGQGDIEADRASLAFDLGASGREALQLLDHFQHMGREREEDHMGLALRKIMGAIVGGPCGPRHCCGSGGGGCPPPGPIERQGPAAAASS